MITLTTTNKGTTTMKQLQKRALNAILCPKENMEVLCWIDPCYRTKKILNYISDLITYYNYSSYDDLPFDEKAEFASYMMDATPKLDEHCCIVESPGFDRTLAFLKKSLCTGLKEDNESFVTSIKTDIVNYYDKRMEYLFNTALEEFHYEREQWSERVAKGTDPDDCYDRMINGL